MINNKSCSLEVLKDESDIFLKRETLNFNYQPPAAKFRQKQLKNMLGYSKNLLSGHATANMLLTGEYNTGKTTTMLTYFQRLKNKYDKSKCVYIQCHNHNTQYKVYTEINKALTDNKLFNGISTSKLYDEIIKRIIKKDIVLIVALDEYNQMKKQEEMNKICNSLLKVTEKDNQAQISLRVSTSKKDKNDYLLDPELNSIFHPVVIDFPPYTPEETYKILENRAEKGIKRMSYQ